VAGCSGGPDRGETERAAPQTTEGPASGQTAPREPAAESSTTESQSLDYGYTYTSESGDRLAGGVADLPEAEVVEAELGGTPRWVAGVSTPEGTAWVAVLEDGGAEAFRLSPEGLEPAELNPRRLPPGAPPLLVSRGGELGLVVAEDESREDGSASRLTHPVPLSSDGSPEGLLVVGEDGTLYVERGGERLGIAEAPATLPDARIVRSAGGDLAALTQPTDRYEHAVLGDALEADSITVLRPSPEEARVLSSFPAASGGVFEGVAPMWFERNGETLLAVTESVAGLGARVSVYRPDGELAGAGPFIGEGLRWRHLTSAAPFGPGGETELSATLTPHMDSAAQFYEVGEAGLEITAGVPGYTSHKIYSRNLDAALAGDLDADGETELLLPTPSYTALGGLARTPGGAEAEWRLPLGGELSTNLASATGPEGRAVVAAGRSDVDGGVLRIWR
jgi:hypothetical protein